MFLNQLEKFKNSTRAQESQSYHKSSRVHWGVTMPECTLLVKSFCKDFEEKELLALAQALWNTNLFDPMMCAGKILGLKKVTPSDQLWKTVVQFLKKVDGWGLEDLLCHAAWKCILTDKTLLDELEKWTDLSNFWMRRAALVYTLPFAKPKQDPERMLKWASKYAKDPEWFIQKAIGWWLRVLGEHNPELVFAFLKDHWPHLKGVAKKEATRKLSNTWQKKAQLLFNHRNS